MVVESHHQSARGDGKREEGCRIPEDAHAGLERNPSPFLVGRLAVDRETTRLPTDRVKIGKHKDENRSNGELNNV